METAESEIAIEEKKSKKKKKIQIQNERSRIAFEKLQLSWVRTSVTILVVGIGAYEYYYERVESGRPGLIKHLTGAQFGLLLVMVSFFVLLLATIQHLKNMKNLKAHYPEMRYSVASLLAFVFMGISLILSVMAFFRF